MVELAELASWTALQPERLVNSVGEAEFVIPSLVLGFKSGGGSDQCAPAVKKFHKAGECSILIVAL